MNFKQIEMFGFKSFADRIKVDFNDGITGIVGPNGCGKSNVADAIRWVLGEQRASTLRGKSMQDVIFNGTARRTPLSFCEVSLTFDNGDGLFSNVAFDEVVITRKLFRSGESEYFINRTPCRLKDIRDMIRDTGLGREGYSIVGQGRIDEIINSRPENRREIFEDATGILTFKQRKNEAKSKLDRAQDSLAKHEIAYNEVSSRIKPLLEESEKAKKYLEIIESLRGWEVNQYLYLHEHNEETKSDIAVRRNLIEAQLCDVLKADEDADEQSRIKSGGIHDADAEIANLQHKYTELSVREADIRGQGNTLAERMDSLARQKAQCANRLVEIENSIDEKKSTLSDCISRVNMAVEELGEIEVEYNEAASVRGALTQEITQREERLESTNAEMLKAADSISELNGNLRAMMAERESVLQRIDELNGEIAEYKTKIQVEEEKKRRSELTADRLDVERKKLASGKNQVAAEAAKLRARMADTVGKQNELTAKISSLDTRLRILKEMQNSYEGFGGAVKLLLQASERDGALASKIQGVVAKIIKTPERLATAVEVALGAAMQNIVTRDEDDAKYLIEYLKANRLGRVTFLPISAYKSRELDYAYRGVLNERGCIGIASKLVTYDKKFESIVGGLLGRTIVCENVDDAIAIARKYSYAFKVVTLQGEVFNPGGSISGGSRKVDAVNLLGQEKEIERVSEALENARAQFREAKEFAGGASARAEELQAQLEEYGEEVKGAEIAYTDEKGRLDAVTLKIEEMLGEVDKRSGSKTNLEYKLTALDNAIGNMSKEGADIKQLRSGADEEAAKSKAEFDKKKRQKDALDEQVGELRTKMAELRKERDNYASRGDGLEREIAVLSEDMDGCRMQLATFDVRIGETETVISQTVVTDEERKRLDEIKGKIDILNAQKLQLSAEVEALGRKKSELAERRVALVRDETKLGDELERLEREMAELQLHIAEDYELDYDGALKFKIEDFDYRVAGAEIAKLKRTKNSLGAVNLNAIDEYKLIGERYRTMTEEREDLIKSIDNLNDVIATLSKDMLTRFNIGFDKINTNFRSIFKELFGGGNGNLVIEEVEEGEDPLTAGIEIYAEPPGKRLQSISLLSGGEKALTAIAILFAILRLKAMPFCVLDEIEAALDDANAGLFAKYLKRFSDETQFIVITHRKPTMELADRLYGVTMQEKGVSTMVAVTLSDAVKMDESATA